MRLRFGKGRAAAFSGVLTNAVIAVLARVEQLNSVA